MHVMENEGKIKTRKENKGKEKPEKSKTEYFILRQRHNINLIPIKL